MSRGYVYLIVNDRIRGRVKIGFTMKDPVLRAAGLKSTGTTGTFVVIYQALVLNPRDVETEVHRRLAIHNVGLEWFEVCPNVAKESIRSCAGNVLFEDTCARWHPSQPDPEAWTKTLLGEAQAAAEKSAAEQEKADRKVRILNERQRVQKAQEECESRRREELAEFEQQAKEKAKELRRTQVALDRQREAEKRKRFLQNAAVAALFIAAVSTALYPVLGPLPQAEINRRRASVEQAESRARSLEQDVVSKRREVARLESQLKTLAATKAATSSDLDLARNNAALAEKHLVATRARLRELAIAEPRDLSRTAELSGGDAAMRAIEEQIEAETKKIGSAEQALHAIPEQEQRLRALLSEATVSAAKAEADLQRQNLAVQAARRTLPQAHLPKGQRASITVE